MSESEKMMMTNDEDITSLASLDLCPGFRTQPHLEL
jgi:hypothetical protein